MKKLVSFDNSQNEHIEDFMPLQAVNATGTPTSNFRKNRKNFNVKRGRMVRSEGGRICFDFNNLRGWVKSLGALRIQSVLFSKLRVRRTRRGRIKRARAGATTIMMAAHALTGARVTGLAVLYQLAPG